MNERVEMCSRQPSTFPNEERQQLQPYLISDTVPGGPPFHHDVLAHIISFVCSDLKTLIAVSAVRRSWRFFANYHHGWRRFQVKPNQAHLERDIFADLKESKIILYKVLNAAGEQPIPFLRDDLYDRDRETRKTIEKKRPSKAYYALGSELPISTPIFLISFVLFAILGCFPLSVAANDTQKDGLHGTIIFRREGAKGTRSGSSSSANGPTPAPTTPTSSPAPLATTATEGTVPTGGPPGGSPQLETVQLNDGRVYLLGYTAARNNGTYFNLRVCNGRVRTEESCTSCACRSRSSSSRDDFSYRRQSTNNSSILPSGRELQPQQQPQAFSSSHDHDYYPRRSGGHCRCCETITYWRECETGRKTFTECPELMGVAKSAVEWGFIHGVISLLAPVIFAALVVAVYCGSCFNSYSAYVPKRKQRNVKYRVLSLFVGLPVQVCLTVTACVSLHYANRLGKTPCPAWETLMRNDGGGDGSILSTQGWSAEHSVRMMTVPSAISLTSGIVTLLVYGIWLGKVIVTRPQRKYQVVP